MKPQTIEEVQDIVCSYTHLRIRGGGSKPALSPPPGDGGVIETTGLSGLLEYDPVEGTFTALAGTPVKLVEIELAKNGQYLPFEPPLVSAGATLGGCVAAGLSGAGRYRYGGLRDFLLGVRFIDGQGNLVRGGGKVVKNAAGFDLPKLLIGSLGMLGIIVELSFKVFPLPAASTTLIFNYPTLAAGLDSLNRLAVSPLELYALELEPDGEQANLLVRLGGLPETLPSRTARLAGFLGIKPFIQLDGNDESLAWASRREFDWVPQDHLLVKVPLTPRRVAALDTRLRQANADRRYGAGGCQAWVAWPRSSAALDSLLAELELPGLVLRGQTHACLVGCQPGQGFGQRVRQALDPLYKFSPG